MFSGLTTLPLVEFDIRGDGTEVVWNTLPLALANNNKYITGLPVGGLPKIKDDKVIFQASHPSLWNGAVIEQMQYNIDAGKFQVHSRPPGRIVLFEVEEGDLKYDSTVGYSQDWIALNIPDPSLSSQKAEALARADQKKAKAVADAVQVHTSAKEKEERKKVDKSFIAHRPPPTAAATRIKKADENARKKEEQERARANATAFAKHRFSDASMASRPQKTSYNFDSGKKLSINSGASTPRSEPSGSSSQHALQLPTPTIPTMESSTPAAHPRQAFKGKQRLSGTNGSGNYQSLVNKSRSIEDGRRAQEWSFSSVPTASSSSFSPWSPAVSSLDPIRTPTIPEAYPHQGLSWPPPGFPMPQWNDSKMEEFQHLMTRFFGKNIRPDPVNY